MHGGYECHPPGLAAPAQTVVEGMDGGVMAEGVCGGHVGAKSSLLMAALVQGCLPTGVAAMWPLRPQLWQFDDEHPGRYEANPGHALQQLGLATPSWMVAQPVLAFPVQGFQFGFSRSRMGPNAMLHGGGYAVQASFVLDAHGDQLVSAHHECTRGRQRHPAGTAQAGSGMSACHPAAGRPPNPL